MPIDNSPHNGEVLHQPDKQFPKPTPDAHPAHHSQSDEAIEGRPEIPSHTQMMAVDVEDEDADPVIESGPGVDTPQTSLFTKD